MLILSGFIEYLQFCRSDLIPRTDPIRTNRTEAITISRDVVPETTAQHITSLHFTALSHRVASHISVSFFPLVQCLTHSLSFFLSQYIYIYISLFPFVSVSHQSRAGRPVFSEHCLSYACVPHSTVQHSTYLRRVSLIDIFRCDADAERSKAAARMSYGAQIKHMHYLLRVKHDTAPCAHLHARITYS